MDTSSVIPIFRKEDNNLSYLEFIWGDEISSLFAEDNADDIIDVSMLKIQLLSSRGLCYLNRIHKIVADKLIVISTIRGLEFVVAIDQEIGVLVDSTIKYKTASDLSPGDTLISFSGEFNNIFQDIEYIDIINELIISSSEDELSGISVVGIREYLRSVNVHGDRKHQNSMDLSSFSSLIADNGVFDEELDAIRLSSNNSDIQVNSKLYITSYLFELLGYFWRYGAFVNEIPVFIVDNYKLAKLITRLVKKALSAGSTITPGSDQSYHISLHSDIYTKIFRDIFGLPGIPSGSNLPQRIFNTETDYIVSFITPLISDNKIITLNEMAKQEILYLLGIVGIFPAVKQCMILLSDEDKKRLSGADVEDYPPIDIVESITLIDGEKREIFRLECDNDYFNGYGILIK